MQKLFSTSEQQTEAIAERLAQTLKGTEVIALFGGMGVGKTAFARGLARGLGVTDGVSSPTFALVHEYEGKYRLYHFDMYRISSYDDLYSTGFFDYQDTGILLIEWSENIEPYLPEDRITIMLRRISDNEREITIEGAVIP
ncbi:MAG: tRNA (adenosine(37)-N6)-threonylcarbamoyltransferase complex ATPase subunit type 1 TsaE [Acutalibacteraceae bacterium]|nr:tRNA (adenosine(37)-N6)-threonylcarbamoyltransferase complex ATPase subunit type 1 TsaE [Acutalibacteraceae bacterium]